MNVTEIRRPANMDRTSLHLIEMTRKKVHRSLAEQVRL